MSQFNIEKVVGSPRLGHTNAAQDIAQYIKREVTFLPPCRRPRPDTIQFDKRKGATWHCIVGRNFGSFVTHGELPWLARAPLTCAQQRLSILFISTSAIARSCSSRRSRPHGVVSYSFACGVGMAIGWTLAMQQRPRCLL